MRILVVDDYPPFASTLRLMIGNEHDVVVSHSGHQALEQIGTNGPFDVMLIDLTMPGMSGLDVYRSLRTQHPPLADRVVFMTGGTSEQVVEDALASVGQPTLEKPFTEDSLRDVLRGFSGTA